MAAHYDDLDRFYREIWGMHVHHGLWRTGRETVEQATQALTERVANLAGIQPGDRVCDVGCGYGETSRWLVEHRGARVTGLTISPAQYHQATSVPSPQSISSIPSIESIAAAAPLAPSTNPAFILCDWLTNDLPSGSFDAAIAIESTEHMRDLPRCFNEMARVLQVGGRAVVCTWQSGDRVGRFAKKHLLEPICAEGRLYGMGTSAEYHALLEQAGFGQIEVADHSREVARTWTICILRTLGRMITSPPLRRYLLGRWNTNRVFAITLVRIRIAYALGAMRYRIISAVRVR